MKKIFLLSLIIILPNLFFAQNLNIQYKKADTLFQKQKFEKALKIYKQIIQQKPSESLAIEKIAKCYFGLNKIDSAKFFIKKAIKLDKSNPEFYSDMSKIFIIQNNTDSSLKYIKIAEKINPKHPRYHVIEGSIYLIKKNLDSALICFKKALSIDSKDADALSNIAYIYSEANKLDTALYYINKAQMYGIKANYYKIKADILYKQSKYSDALLEMQKAFYLDSSLANVISIAQIYNQLGQFNDIVNLTRPYIKKTFEPNLYYYTILAYYNLNEIDSAMYLLSIAHKLDNTNDIFYYMEGLINFSEKNYENAYLNFNVAIELNPKQPNYFFSASKAKIFANTNPSVLNMDGKFVFFNQANIKKFKKLSKKKKSKYYFNRLLAKLSSDPTSMSLDEYFMLYVGNAFQKNFSGYGNTNPQIERYFEQQKYNKCISLANTFLDNNPTSVNTYFFIANSYYSLGKYNLALKYLIPYYGFVEAILATGNGTSPQSPYIVTSIADEYAILRYFGYSFSGQNFLDNKKHAYDIIQYSDGNNKKSIFFNIDLFELNKK